MREEKGEQVVIREILPKHRMVDSVLAPGQWEEAVFVRNSAAPPNEEILFQETETQSEPAQAVKTASSSMGIRGAIINVLVYVLITGGMVLGVPRALSAVLNTPFPMAAITSGSMWPELKVGSLVFIQGIDGREVRVGDIIVFRNENNTFTIHRVAELKENSLTTKGDANFKEDEPIAYKDVIGRAVVVSGKPLSIPHLGSITVFASNLKQ